MLAAAFLGAALIVYRPALRGEFISDDFHYVVTNAFVHELSLANTLALFDPFGESTQTIVNYAPVQMFIHTLAWQAFGGEVLGHHVLNLVLHCLAALLLVAVFARSGIPRTAAVLGGAFFLLHPANVEAVAWINQLKSSSAMVLSLAALLVVPRRPGLGAACFAAALLAKPVAAYALPAAALFEWAREGRVRWRWYALWAALFAAFAIVEFGVHQRYGAAESVLHATPFALVRTMAAIGLRYLVMAATSWGVSAFHEPEPAWSPLDPWWLAALVAFGLLAWRAVRVARRRQPELAYWTWAAVAYAPVSQIFPFLYPMADRYLYFILPGLVGGALLAARDAVARLSRVEQRVFAARAGAVLGAVALVAMGVRSVERAAVWRSAATVLVDSATHYPDGVSASLLRAKRAVQMGDVVSAVAAVRAAADRGYNRFDQLLTDPGFAPVRDHPSFRALVSEIAQGWIERGRALENPSQRDLRMVGNAHFARGEREEAAAALRQALEVGGKYDEEIRRDLERLALQ